MAGMDYRHTQRGRATLVVCTLGALVVLGIAATLPPPIPVGAVASAGFAAIVMVSCAWAFSSLTVQVANGELSWYFGPGVMRKRIPLVEIASATPARTALWQGIGIHWIGVGWLYNVALGDAVEVLTVRGKRVRIGTDEPVALSNAIERAVRGAASR